MTDRDPNPMKMGWIFGRMFKNFMKLWGYDTPSEIPDSYSESQPILTEEHFTKNMHFLVGDMASAPYFGKLLYIYLAKGRDRIKITINRFFEGLIPFAFEENK
jgi:hypothetical protein